MNKKSLLWSVMSLLVLASMLLAACGSSAATEAPAAEEPAATEAAAVGVVQIFESPVDTFSISTLLQAQPAYKNALDANGITAFTRDEDAIVRSVQAYDIYKDKIYYHWAFEVARLYLDVEPPTQPTDTSIQFNGQAVPLRGKQCNVISRIKRFCFMA